MALLYGVPLLLGSAGAFFAGSMFDEKEEEALPVSEPGSSILSPQSTETAPGVPGQATSSNTSSFMPSINITAPGWMGGPPQQQPPQKQSSWFGGPPQQQPPQQQQSSWFGGPVTPQPIQAPAPAPAPEPTVLDTIVPPSTPSGPDALEEAVGQVPPGGTGPDALEQAVGEIPPGGTGPDALEQAVGEIPPGGTGPDALEQAVGKLPPGGTGPDALENVVGNLPTPGTGPDALEDAVGKLPAPGTGPDALEDAVGKLPPAGTGPDALEDVVGKLPPGGTGPDALEDVSTVASEKLAAPPAGTEDALSQVGPALSEPIKELQEESKRSDRDAVPEAAALVGSLVSSAQAAVSPSAPSAPSPDSPTPVPAPTEVVIPEAAATPASAPEAAATPASAPEAAAPEAPAPEAPAPEAPAPPQPKPKSSLTNISLSSLGLRPLFSGKTPQEIKKLATEPAPALTPEAPSDVPVLISLSPSPSVNAVSAFFNQQYMKSEKIDEESKQTALRETKQSLNDFVSQSSASKESLDASDKFNALEQTFINESKTRRAKREAYLKKISNKEAAVAAAAAAETAEQNRRIGLATRSVGDRGDGIPLDLKIRATKGLLGTSNVPTFGVNEFFNQPFLTAARGNVLAPKLLGPETSQEKLIAEAEEHFVTDSVARMNTKERIKFNSMLQKWRDDKPKREKLRKDYYNSLIQSGVSADEAQIQTYGPGVAPTNTTGGNKKTRNNRRPNRWTHRRKR